ncbi:MAG: hypothetical protein JNK53_09070 [Phycisphaerae bacterium]|nr:hypothetical protein [Phycisphaerae bacterium]
MRWWIFVPAALACVALDAAFMSVLSIGGHWPCLTAVLMAWVALYASRDAALAGALLVGLYADAQAPNVFGHESIVVLGPHMLAWVLAVWAVVEVREILYRRSALTVAVAACALVVGQSLVYLAVCGVRVVYADPAPLWGTGSGGWAFGHDVLDALYTLVLAWPIAWLLPITMEWWGFAHGGARFGRR